MPNLAQTRKRMKAALFVLLAIDALTMAFLFSPLTSPPDVRRRDLEKAENDLQLKRKEVEPLTGMDEKLKKADQELNEFYKNRLPDRNSAIITELRKLAEQNKIRITSEKWEHSESDLPELMEVTINANVEGDYLGIVKFINGLERSKLFFILDGVGLAGEQAGGIKLGVKLRTYMKTSGT
jgi:Tfp pilus assembly protein PilO